MKPEARMLTQVEVEALDLIDMEEAARLLGVSRKDVGYAMRFHRIGYYTGGGNLRLNRAEVQGIDRKDIPDLIRRHQTKRPEDAPQRFLRAKQRKPTNVSTPGNRTQGRRRMIRRLGCPILPPRRGQAAQGGDCGDGGLTPLYCGRLGMQVCVPATAAGAIPDDKKPERMSDEQFEELRLIPPDYCEADCARVAEVALIGGVPRARHLRPELERKHDNRRNPQKRLAPRNSGLLRRKPLKSLRTGETTGPALKTQGRGVERA